MITFLAVALPPHSFGACVRAVLLVRAGEQGWHVTVDGHALSSSFASERAAREAGAAEGARLDAVARALLVRVRRGLSRKRT